jgi:CARDB
MATTRGLLFASLAAIVALAPLGWSCDNRSEPRGGAGLTQPKPLPKPVDAQSGPPPGPEKLPDFVIVSSERSPSGMVMGTRVRFTFQVRNAGDAPYDGPIVVSGPGNQSGSIVGGLRPGETKSVMIDFPVFSRGATFSGVVFTVDPDHVVRESNENNNRSDEFTITTAPQ